MSKVRIILRPNGPLRVEDPEGLVELCDANGNRFDLTGKPAFSLCRCDGSTNMPFCDGTHSKIGFRAAETAVAAETQAQAGPGRGGFCKTNMPIGRATRHARCAKMP